MCGFDSFNSCYIPDPSAGGESVGQYCSQACACMVLCMYGITCSVKEMCHRSNAFWSDASLSARNDSGTTAVDIQNALNTFDFNGKLYSGVQLYAPEPCNHSSEHLRTVVKQAPKVIAYVAASVLYGGVKQQFAHAVVLLGIEGDQVVYHDPDSRYGSGLRIGRRTFMRAWRNHGHVAIMVG